MPPAGDPEIDVLSAAPAQGSGDRNGLTDWPRIAVAVVVLVCLSSAPFVQISVRLVHRPYDALTWAYVFPYWFCALVGVGIVTARMALSRERLVVFRELAPILALASWALLSVLWTESPARTPIEALLMSGMLFTAVYFGGNLNVTAQITALFVALHLLAVGSLMQRWLWPRFAMNDAGWIGLFGSRNTLGPIATLGILSGFALWFTTRRHLALTVAVLVSVCIDVLLAYRAGSDTAWVALVVAIGAVGVARLLGVALRKGMPGRLLVVSAGALFGSIALMFVIAGSQISSKFGKGTTFSGRREVWDFVIDAVRTRPIVGFGYASFWDAPSNTQRLLDETGVAYNAAHNSFLEVALWLGVVGLVLAVWVITKSFVSTWGALAYGSPNAEWWVGLVTFALIENMTESMIAYHSLFWTLLVAGAYTSAVNRAWLWPPTRSSRFD